ncbi:MAG: carbohydrate-binding protein, partial [Planctomycetota bacterium]
MRADVMRSGVLLSIIGLMILCTDGYGAYQLVWSDEFDGTSLNTANWSYQDGDGCPNLCGWGNNELQWYRSQNTTVSGGNLIITAKEESYGGRDYTSGKIISRYKQDFLYGRMEARIQVPTGGGIWPAFWMMPTDEVYGGWAASGEIDIMETCNNTDYIGGTIHYGGNWPDNRYSGGNYSPGGMDFSDAFHVYTIEWDLDEIRWYVDGNLYSTKTSSLWYSDSDPGNPRAPFDQEFYFILNVAVGGNYTGCTSSGCISASFPQQMLVDYVRVYQESPNNAPTVSITNPSDGATLPAGNITIDATASDSDGSVATVEFYADGSYLGEDTTAPYSYTWNSVTDGCYTIMARAVDDLGGYSTDSIDIEVGTGCPQIPYYDSPMAIPGQIEAEDFDLGGEGSAYHDSDAANNGGQYRTSEGVDIETCAEGGYDVGWISADEWLEYTVDVATAGDYTIEARVASNATGGNFHIEFDGLDVTGNINVPITGGWQAWTTVSATATLSDSIQVMRFVNATSGDEYNLNYFNFVYNAPDTDAPTPNPATFTVVPAADSDTAISMTATTGTDVSGPVEYFFDETSGNPGGTDSGWQTSASYTDTGLTASTQYTYTVTMRDALGNTGTVSAPANATTDAPTVWIPVIYDDFEAGFGNWVDGGTDCIRYTGGAYAYQGNAAINLQDNTSTSVMSTNDLVLSAYDEIKVDFAYYCNSMDNSNEDFWLQISTNGGGTYNTVQAWVRSIDFENDQFYTESVTITGYTLTDQTRIRFRCDASGDNDDVYIDVVDISASGGVMVPVPNVLGMDQPSAQDTITAAGLSVGVIGQSFDNTVAAGVTKSQTPSGGTSVSSGSAVDLEISLGICGDLDV